MPASPGEKPPASLPPGVLPVTDPVAAAEEALIRKAVDAEEDAWNRGDAKAFAARFQEEGSLTDVLGAVSRGRAEIERRQSELFSSYFKGSRLALKVRKIRFLKPDVALIEIDTEVSGFHKAPPAVYVDTEKVIRTRLLQVDGEVRKRLDGRVVPQRRRQDAAGKARRAGGGPDGRGRGRSPALTPRTPTSILVIRERHETSVVRRAAG